MDKTITLDDKFFGHLLDCMCNQKYLPTLAASELASDREKHDQEIIDKAYQKARDLWCQNDIDKEQQRVMQCACSKESNAYQQELDEIVKDPRQVELYLEEHIKSGDVELAMIVMRDIIEAERRKFSDRLDALEKRAGEIEKCIEALEQCQVTRQEFDELKAEVDALKARVEDLEKTQRSTQRSLTEVVVRI